MQLSASAKIELMERNPYRNLMKSTSGSPYTVVSLGLGTERNESEFDNFEDAINSMSGGGSFWIEDESGWRMKVYVLDGHFEVGHLRHGEDFVDELGHLFGGKQKALNRVQVLPMHYASRPYKSRWNDVRECLHGDYVVSLDLLAKRDDVANSKIDRAAGVLENAGLEGNVHLVDSLDYMPDPSKGWRTMHGPFKRSEFDDALGESMASLEPGAFKDLKRHSSRERRKRKTPRKPKL